MAYQVLTLDLFHNYEENTSGLFPSGRQAIEMAGRIVEASLEALHQPGMTANDSMEAWQRFGDSAVVIGTDGSPPPQFLAVDFAQSYAAIWRRVGRQRGPWGREQGSDVGTLGGPSGAQDGTPVGTADAWGWRAN
jgi:hypothetical protein